MTDTDDLSARLHDEADLCRNEGADDCAQLFDEAIQAIDTLHEKRRELEAERDRLRAGLLACARQAEALKRDCSPDHESWQSIRNAQYQAISTAAHIALGTVRGPDPILGDSELNKLRAENEALKSERAVWNCKTHGRRLNHWGCPDCVRELCAENEALVGLLREAHRCMIDAKRRWAPTTTNSDADVCIERINRILRDDAEISKERQP